MERLHEGIIPMQEIGGYRVGRTFAARMRIVGSLQYMTLSSVTAKHNSVPTSRYSTCKYRNCSFPEIALLR